MIQIAPSILSADFGNLARDLKMVEQAGAHLLHVDVMDGHFVPNLTYGPLIIKKCKELSKLPIDAHLMVSNAEQTVDMYIDAGADFISVHQEAVNHLQRLLVYIREHGVKAGVALNPATPVGTLRWVVKDLDFVLIMTVNPGFEAQQFIPQCLEKISRTRDFLDKHGSDAVIEVDGGVNIQNISELKAAGARMMVAGSAIFKSESPESTIKQMLDA